MEFCEGGDLHQLIRQQQRMWSERPASQSSKGDQQRAVRTTAASKDPARSGLEEKQIWSYFIQTCLGLHQLHSRKTLHRDLKAMNLFLTADGRLKIGDLGVAKVLSTQSHFAHSAIGTPYYLSPELCEGQPYNHLSDVWALGCVLYEMCTLRHPFDASNQAALVLKIIRGRYEPIAPSYSPALRQVLAQCLSRDYRKRPSVQRLLTSEGVLARATQLQLLTHYPAELLPKADIPAALPAASVPERDKSASVSGKASSSYVGRPQPKVDAPRMVRARLASPLIPTPVTAVKSSARVKSASSQARRSQGTVTVMTSLDDLRLDNVAEEIALLRSQAPTSVEPDDAVIAIEATSASVHQLADTQTSSSTPTDEEQLGDNQVEDFVAVPLWRVCEEECPSIGFDEAPTVNQDELRNPSVQLAQVRMKGSCLIGDESFQLLVKLLQQHGASKYMQDEAASTESQFACVDDDHEAEAEVC